MEFVGVTCAACHVSELRHGRRSMRVDGAPNMLNLQQFYAEAIDALFAIRSDDIGKLWRALKRLGRQDFDRYSIAAPFVRPALIGYYAANVALNREKLNARLELIRVIRTAKVLREEAKKKGSNEPATSGFGRLDAFDGTRNFLLTRLRKEDIGGEFKVNIKNMVKLNAPTKFPQVWSLKAEKPGDISIYYDDPAKFPQVWGFKDYSWLEWTLNTDTVLERNFTETLGAGATVVLDPAAGASLFNSSISINNLHDLEWLTYYIDPPRWPAELFGRRRCGPGGTRQGAVQAIAARTVTNMVPNDRTETGLLRLRGRSLDIAGTDPAAALRISCPVPDIGAIDVASRPLTAEQADLLKDCAGVTAETRQAKGFASVTQKVVDEIKKKAYAAEGIDEVRRRKIEDLDRRKKVVWRDTLLDTAPPDGPYAARPLHGIWAAAPYLHNGSVPTLHDLLLPPEQRPKQFALGSREFDPKKVGFAVTTNCTVQDCLVDTTLAGAGNANTGHLFGTDLSESERAALIEFLKTY